MRLISQEASPYVDIPYEACVIEVAKNYGNIYSILAIPVGKDVTYPMAIYASKENTEKVLDGLRKTYQYFDGGVFKFPKDEEV